MQTTGNATGSISRSMSKRDGMIFTEAFHPPLSPTSTPPSLPPSSPVTSFEDLAEDEPSTPSVHSQSDSDRSRSISIPSHSSQGSRKLSRKLPPNLTESLECIALFATAQPTTPVKVHKDLFPATYTLGAVQPLPDTPPSVTPPPQRSPKSPARKMSKASISGPTPIATKEPDALPPLTPRTSLPSLRSGPRHSLFGYSALPRQLQPSSSSSSLRSPRESNDHSRFAPSEGVPALSCSSGSATESTCGTTWSSFDAGDHHHHLSSSPSARSRESRKQRKARRTAEKARFDESTPPSTNELYEASLMDVVDEHGNKVKFGDLVRGQKTIVVFIRHWFCPLCAQYIKSVIQDVSPDALEDAGVELIIIGNGSAKMINGYANKFFNSPFKTYTDPTLSLYRVLGLTRQTMDAGSDSERGDYLTETALETTVNTLKRASKMPLRNPGHFTQLGGEFVFEGTLNVVYTHRMVNTRAHAPIRDVCREAGVRLEFIHYEPGPAPPAVHMRSTEMLGHYPTEVDPAGQEVDAEDDWFTQKEKTLERIRTMRAERRNGGSLDTRSERGVRVVIPEEDEDVDEFGQLTRELYA